MEINNFENKKMKQLTSKQQKPYQNEKNVIFVKKKLKVNILKIKIILKLGIIVFIQENINLPHIEGN